MVIQLGVQVLHELFFILFYFFEFESSCGDISCSLSIHVGWGITFALGFVRCFEVLACPKELKERHFSCSNHFVELICGAYL